VELLTAPKGLAISLGTRQRAISCLVGLFAKLHETYERHGNLIGGASFWFSGLLSKMPRKVGCRCRLEPIERLLVKQIECRAAAREGLWHEAEVSAISASPVQSTYEIKRTSTSHGNGEVSRLSVQVKSGGAGLHSWKTAQATRPECSRRL
jgi:hypothetical protein